VTTAVEASALPLDELGLLAQMTLIRAVEKAAYDLFLAGLVKGTTHLAAGHEAVAVGAAAVLEPEDYVWATYRGHHHFLAKGGSPEACLAELMGRATGACGGKGGSMHLTSAEHNMMGSFAIVGAQLALACGSAWSARLRGTDQVTLAFHGDGATNIGTFHEALNLAAIWRLPVVFVCENNLYMEYTPIASVTSVAHPAADRAVGHGIPASVIDGNDVLVVAAAVREAVARARAGDGPTVIEAMTYRHHGHSRTDPGKYRPQDEVERWLARDPLLVSADRLSAAGTSAADLAALRADADARTAAAVEAARNGPEPDPASAFADLWADGGSAWRT
jgi:TPP-dependent pyruvate/acetoin dehydrogenase alpha subunit